MTELRHFFGERLCSLAQWELQFMYDQMDGLIIAYESVYGPLPEGIL